MEEQSVPARLRWLQGSSTEDLSERSKECVRAESCILPILERRKSNPEIIAGDEIFTLVLPPYPMPQTAVITPNPFVTSLLEQ
jgi:hypothetical protein